jgi:two-component system OmpR family sensor kinase
MNRLWVRLSLCFAAITAVAIVTVAVLVNRQVMAQLPSFVAHQQLADSGLVDALATYYQDHGTWVGVETIFAGMRASGGQGHGQGKLASGMGLALADAQGRILSIDAGNQPITRTVGQQLTSAEKDNALPISVNRNTVGYLVVTTPAQATLSPAAQYFLTQINQSLILAGLAVGGIGLLLGLALAYGLARPLRGLEAATRRIAQGALDQRAPLRGPREVVALASSFNDMAASLQQAERQRQQLVSDVSHELRTPITVLQGNLRALLDDVFPLEKAEIAALYDETLLLSRLVDDLGELARAESGRLALDPRPLPLGPLVERTTSLFQEVAEEKSITLSTAIAPDLPLALADPHRTEQVLHNLLSNAARHTPAGGQIAVRVATDTTDTSLRITVTDSGQGIAREDLPHVFERFWRADRSRAREYGGSGLGLAIAKALIEAQGGSIGVESTLGVSSRFWVTLPVASDTFLTTNAQSGATPDAEKAAR